MSQGTSLFEGFTGADFAKIRARARKRDYKGGERIFSEGDAADCIYFIESGQVAVLIQKFTRQEEVSTLGPGEHFGEMAFFNRDKRTASVVARTDTVLLGVDKDAFLQLMATDRAIADRIGSVLVRRNEELMLKESLIDAAGLNGRHLHVCIKGDPSLRESTFTRERYESVVDKVLLRLVPRLEDLLLNRCIYRAYIGFNNGEIHTTSIFDPFRDEVHPADKVIDEGYIDRHFPYVAYGQKAAMVRRLYAAIAADPEFVSLPENFLRRLSGQQAAWEPVAPAEIANTLARLAALRNLPNFYLRNLTISMAQDAIRMQFNCDGTHIVSAEDYLRFLEENV